MKYKKASVFQITLIVVAIVVAGLFIYGIKDLQNQQNQGNQTVKTFGEFLSDVFKKTEVKESAKDAEESLRYLNVNACKLRDITCIPVFDKEGEIKFIFTNTIKKINYDLNNVVITIQALNLENCSGKLEGPAKLLGSGPGRTANYTRACNFEKYVEGNVTFHGVSKEGVSFDETGRFFLKNI